MSRRCDPVNEAAERLAMLWLLEHGPHTTRELGDRARAEMERVHGRYVGSPDDPLCTLVCLAARRLARLHRVGLVSKLNVGGRCLWWADVNADGLANSALAEMGDTDG